MSGLGIGIVTALMVVTDEVDRVSVTCNSCRRFPAVKADACYSNIALTDMVKIVLVATHIDYR